MRYVWGLADRRCADGKVLRPLSHWFQGSDGSFSSRVSFRKRKGDEMDGMVEVAKKKSKKEKDKDSRLERALKVSSELCVSTYRCVNFCPHSGRKVPGGVCVPLTKTSKNSQTGSSGEIARRSLHPQRRPWCLKESPTALCILHLEGHWRTLRTEC